MKASYPYSQDGGAAPPAAPRLPIGAAEVVAGDGRPGCQQIEARIPKPAPLEQALRAEGHQVHEVRGPVGTTEHILVLRRS